MKPLAALAALCLARAEPALGGADSLDAASSSAAALVRSATAGRGSKGRDDPRSAGICGAMAGPKEGPAEDAEVLAALNLPSSRVVLLNEYHFQSVTLAYPDLIRKIKAAAPRVNCLYMEYIPGMEPKSKEEARRDIPAYAAIFETAFDLGLRILYVDAHKSPSTGSESDHGSVVRRNPEMVDRIVRSLDEGACDAGIMIVGKAHGYSSVDGQPTRPMTEHLASRNVQAASINLVDRYVAECPDGRVRCAVALLAAEDFVQAPNRHEAAYSACMHGQGFARGTGFVNRRTGDVCSIPAESSGWGSACDFDATLFY
jgi:hypothetical protein